ncbi:prolipoprotein diacylglyceryl transferase [Candidatus Peregrinibacteria bacterium]|jgi:phosphatidylglycerol---prolipoprotein diacylglyceryl transferase|nr:prolipoprotein diacylglyceryl transferase [Candidatus Peregrinibacteria bacterium]
MIQFLPSREVAIAIGSFSIHWYGLMYMLAFAIALFLTPRIQKYRDLHISKDEMASIVTWAIGGVIIGGRLGYVLFYEFSYFVSEPLEIFAVWHGGMSSHGGFIGVSIALWFALKKYYIPLMPFLDIITVPIALGLACGRFGNFINLELYGIVTTLPWGIEIPGVEGLRHPTQIYAVVKDLSIAFLCFALLTNRFIKTGMPFAVFLILYGVLRTIVEVFRVPSHAELDFGFIILTRGQALSLPIVCIGFVLLMWTRSTAR